jgi:hypothetical protein
VNLEPLIGYWLREIAANRGIPLSHLAEEIDRDYRLTTPGSVRRMRARASIITRTLAFLSSGTHRPGPKTFSRAPMPRRDSEKLAGASCGRSAGVSCLACFLV